jgi:hypothetical protein
MFEGGPCYRDRINKMNTLYPGNGTLNAAAVPAALHAGKVLGGRAMPDAGGKAARRSTVHSSLRQQGIGFAGNRVM